MAFNVVIWLSFLYIKVLQSTIRSYLKVFLSLYSVNGEISKVCLHIFVCGSETGFLAWVRKNTRR